MKQKEVIETEVCKIKQISGVYVWIGFVRNDIGFSITEAQNFDSFLGYRYKGVDHLVPYCWGWKFQKDVYTHLPFLARTDPENFKAEWCHADAAVFEGFSSEDDIGE